MFPEPVAHVFTHRERIEERRPLEDHGHLPADAGQLPVVEAGNVLTRHLNRPAFRFVQSKNETEDRRLTRSAPPEDDLRLTGSHLKSDLLQDSSVAQGQEHVVQRDHGPPASLRDHEIAMNSLVMKKSVARIRIEEETIDWVVERPTPTVPPFVVNPE